jgi:hypothetical protein
MRTHPVQFVVAPSEKRERIDVLIRLVLLFALGAIGFSSLYWILYLVLPAVAAAMISAAGGKGYLANDAPGIVRGLRWLAGVYAYLWLLTDALPTRAAAPGGSVELQVELGGTPTTKSALLRLFYSLPALALLALLSIPAGVLWLLGAVVILVRGRASPAISDFFALTLRYQFRLLAYHLSLVDAYPALVRDATEHELHYPRAA